jgi:hypothetical protein
MWYFAVSILYFLTIIFVSSAPAQDYLVYVVSESADKISLIRFGPKGARIEREIPTGLMEPDIDGPHGIAISPDREHYFVSLGHGRPYGTVWKYDAKTDRVIGKVGLGFFPATMEVSPDGNFVYVVNFNLHGDMAPSSVSVVLANEMLEIKRIPTCTMPHGSRFNPQGTRHYSACMMDDMLVEIDTETLKVSRHYLLTKGKEAGGDGEPPQPTKDHSTHVRHESAGHTGHGLEPPKPGDISCSPTWAQPSSDGSMVYVACNKSSEIVEVDAKTWKITRRIPPGRLQSGCNERRANDRHQQARPIGLGLRSEIRQGTREHSDEAQGRSRRGRLPRQPLCFHFSRRHRQRARHSRSDRSGDVEDCRNCRCGPASSGNRFLTD